MTSWTMPKPCPADPVQGDHFALVRWSTTTALIIKKHLGQKRQFCETVKAAGKDGPRPWRYDRGRSAVS
jgi:hypothetical protein